MSVSLPKILDCTLRDGGYYNDWDFSLEFGENLIAALVESGVDVIEVGYRSLPQKKYCGAFKYCPESALGFLAKYPNVEFAFMIDVKEYVVDDKLNEQLLNSVFKPKKDSHFSVARIAAYYAQLDNSVEAINYFNKLGYKVCFNLMGSAMLTQQQIANALQQVSALQLEAFYIADSFGSMYPHEVKNLIKFVRNNYKGNLGLHLHENQGMAYANALAALEEGVEYMDATVTGMGRGAGNLVMEQFLQGYANSTNNPKIKPHALLDFIAQYMAPLKNHYQWGFNYVYMLSGLKNIHPTYCQALLEGNRYTFSQISAILSSIPAENKGKYTEQVLNAAIKSVLSSNGETDPGYELKTYTGKKLNKVLVVAGGESAKEHLEGINYLIQQKDVQVFECNNTGLLSDVAQRLTIILNKVKLQHYVSTHAKLSNTVVTGQKHMDEVTEGNAPFYFPYVIDDYSKAANAVHIPDYDAGMYAIALAEAFGACEIYLAGFDGFEAPEKNEHMQQFFAAYHKATDKKLIVLTPTNYNSAGLVKSSVYSTLL